MLSCAEFSRSSIAFLPTGQQERNDILELHSICSKYLELNLQDFNTKASRSDSITINIITLIIIIMAMAKIIITIIIL